MKYSVAEVRVLDRPTNTNESFLPIADVRLSPNAFIRKGPICSKCIGFQMTWLKLGFWARYRQERCHLGTVTGLQRYAAITLKNFLIFQRRWSSWEVAVEWVYWLFNMFRLPEGTHSDYPHILSWYSFRWDGRVCLFRSLFILWSSSVAVSSLMKSFLQKSMLGLMGEVALHEQLFNGISSCRLTC